MNNAFGKLDNSTIIAAPDAVVIVIHHHDEWDDPDSGEKHSTDWDERKGILHPTAADYLIAENGPFYPVSNETPAKVGVTFSPTNRGELRDGVIYRIYEETPIVAPTPVYKVEDIIYGLITRNALAAAKGVVGDYWELFTMREIIESNNEIWAARIGEITAAIVATGALTEADIEAILKDAEV